MKITPLVSVIMTVFNGERYLREAIESVLSQDYRTIEIILIDDGSTDGSAGVAKWFIPPVRYVFQPHGGLGAALNHGISLSGGNLLAFLDADDLWTEDKLTRQMTAFDNDPGLDAVFGHVKQFYSPEIAEDQRKRVQIPSEVMPGFFKGCMLIKRDSFSRVGMFDAKWKVGDFVDWYLRAAEKDLKTIMMDEVVLLRRIHLTNVGLQERKSRIDFVRILKASLDRRRGRHTREGPAE